MNFHQPVLQLHDQNIGLDLHLEKYNYIKVHCFFLQDSFADQDLHFKKNSLTNCDCSIPPLLSVPLMQLPAPSWTLEESTSNARHEPMEICQ